MAGGGGRDWHREAGPGREGTPGGSTVTLCLQPRDHASSSELRSSRLPPGTRPCSMQAPPPISRAISKKLKGLSGSYLLACLNSLGVIAPITQMEKQR